MSANRTYRNAPVEHGHEDAHAQLRPEEIVFALRDAVTNHASFPVGKFRRRCEAAIIAEGKRADLHTVESVRAVLNEYDVFVLITKEEDERLNRAGYRHKMPTEWDGRDPLARYKAVGIELVENTPAHSTS